MELPNIALCTPREAAIILDRDGRPAQKLVAAICGMDNYLGQCLISGVTFSTHKCSIESQL